MITREELSSSLREYLDNVDKRIPYVNVKEFGAKGDGITDDTHAIQMAINEILNNSNEGTLYFPSGNYLISSTLNFYKSGLYYNIIGDGRRKTRITAINNMDSMFKLCPNNETYCSYRISDLMINLSSFADIGIDASYTIYSTIENCYFETKKDNSKMLIISSWCNRVLNNLFTGSYSYTGAITGLDIVVGTAIYCPSNLSTNNLIIENNVIQKIENSIILDDYANDVHIKNNTFDNVGRIIISTKGLKNCSFHYNYCEACGGRNNLQYTLNPINYKDGSYTRSLLSPFILTEEIIMSTQYKTSISIKYNQFANCYRKDLVSVSLPRLFEFTDNDLYDYSSYTYDNIVNVFGKGVHNDCKLRVENNNAQAQTLVTWDINNAGHFTNRGDVEIFNYRQQPSFETRSTSTGLVNEDEYIINTTRLKREFTLGNQDYKNPFKIIVEFDKISGTKLKYDLYADSNALLYNMESNVDSSLQVIYYANEIRDIPYKDFKLYLYSDGDLKLKSVKLITSNKYNRVVDLLK